MYNIIYSYSILSKKKNADFTKLEIFSCVPFKRKILTGKFPKPLLTFVISNSVSENYI